MGREFQPGDLVKIREGMHEEGMGDERIALVLSEWLPKGTDRNPRMKYTAIYNIKMLNGHRMRVHEMFLERMNENGTSVE